MIQITKFENYSYKILTKQRTVLNLRDNQALANNSIQFEKMEVRNNTQLHPQFTLKDIKMVFLKTQKNIIILNNYI